MALRIPRSNFRLARLLCVRPDTFGPTLVFVQGQPARRGLEGAFRCRFRHELFIREAKCTVATLLTACQSAASAFCYWYKKLLLVGESSRCDSRVSKAFFTEKFLLLFSQAAWREPHAAWERRFDNPWYAAWEPRFDNPWYIVGASSTMNVFTGRAFERDH